MSGVAVIVFAPVNKQVLDRVAESVEVTSEAPTELLFAVLRQPFFLFTERCYSFRSIFIALCLCNSRQHDNTAHTQSENDP